MSSFEQPRPVWCCSTCGAIYHKDYPRCPSDGAEVVMTARDPMLGTTVGHYVIEKLVGEGGMGRVYLANHASLPNKRYAFKVLLGDHAASSAMRARFTREAERASQLDHPNVCRVVDFGQTTHGVLYIVMDYVEGPSLMDLIEEGPMPAARVVALARGVCDGLDYAHAAGIVHRDLKPENVLVSPGEVPRIVDFGLAVSVDQTDARLTESGMTMGTPAFAAPEQLAGKPIDHRADLYALGMTMFEMLTGGLAPFEGQLMEVVSARTTRDAPRISQRSPKAGVPRGLEDVVARLTRRKPEERYASARELGAALDDLRIPAGPEGRIPTERLRIRRSRGWLVAGLGACGVAVACWFALAADEPATTAAVVAPVPVEKPVVREQVVTPVAPPAPVPVKPRPKRVAFVEDSEPARPADRPPGAHARVEGIHVNGALPASEVQRAVARQADALARCTAASPHTLTAYFTIGEARRAMGVRTEGGTSSCVSAALGGVRTESAPDMGDVQVRVEVAFVVST